MPTCLAICPRDINIILVGYEGGVVAWDFRQAAVIKTFEMTLPPGAPGGGTYDDAGVSWIRSTLSRGSQADCIVIVDRTYTDSHIDDMASGWSSFCRRPF